MKNNLKKIFLILVLVLPGMFVVAGGIKEGPSSCMLEATHNINILDKTANLGFYDVQFFTLEEGISALHTENRGLIYSTYDGGLEWQIVLENLFELGKFFFLDRNIGWAGFPFGQILQTEDGGKIWVEKSRKIKGVNLISGLYFLNQHKGYAVTNNNNLYSTNYGRSTREATKLTGLPVKPIINDIFAIYDNEVWLVGINLILQSIDGGKTWINREKAIEGELNSKMFIHIIFDDSENKGWILADKGIILYTNDSSETWSTGILEEESELLFIDLENKKLYGDNDRVLPIYGI